MNKKFPQTISEMKKKFSEIKKSFSLFLAIEILCLRKKLTKKISPKIICKIFSHRFGADEQNFSEVKRFAEFGFAQKRFMKKCKFCSMRSFSRVNQFGKLYWENEST